MKIFEGEKKFLKFFEENMHWVALALALVVGVLVRLPGADFKSGDYNSFLVHWYDEIEQNGIGKQVGNYNLIYQFFVLIMTKLPMPDLHAYKLFSCIFDFGLAFSAWYLVRAIVGKENKWAPVAVLSAVLISPVVVLNSSVWAQCDSMFACFAVLAVALFIRGKYPHSMVAIGVSLGFKLQAIFFLPAFLLAYFVRKRFSALSFLIVPVAMIATGLPTLFYGRNLLDVFSIYAGQTGTYPSMAMNYPSVWQLFTNVNWWESASEAHYELLSTPAILLTFAVLIGLAIFIIIKKIPMSNKNMLCVTFIMVYACVLILPSMHERYSFGYEILALAIACIDKRTIPLCVAMNCITLMSYSNFLFGVLVVPFTTLAIINIVVFILYAWLLIKDMVLRAEKRAELASQAKMNN